jgi:periplasmic protein TonB
MATESSNALNGAVVAQPDDLHNSPPVYPDESRMAHEEGVVILHVEVTSAGEAASVGIKQSSGYFRLDQAALQAVKHWRFHPGLVAGLPVESETDVPVRFKLE